MSQVGPIEVAVPSDVARTFIADVGSAVPIASVINFFGDATQGISSSAAGNTVTYTVADATTSQKGVVEYATLTETIDGSSNTLGTTPAGVNAKIGNQTTIV